MICALTLAATLLGCGVADPKVPEVPRVPKSLGCEANESVASIHQRYQPSVAALSARIDRRDGTTGYGARAVLEKMAHDRDALLQAELTESRAMARCAPPGLERDRALRSVASNLSRWSDGLSPRSPLPDLYVIDCRRNPTSFPLTRLACRGKLEDIMNCMLAMPFTGIVDLVSFPTGSWFWSSEVESTKMTLWEIPVPPRLKESVEREVLDRAEQDLGRARVAKAGVETSVEPTSSESPAR